MALVLNLRSVENLEGKADRIARCTFRGRWCEKHTAPAVGEGRIQDAAPSKVSGYGDCMEEVSER